MDFIQKSFIKSFCCFEINNVNLYLNNARNYNKISKEEFVFTLSEWFKELKNNKNTECPPQGSTISAILNITSNKRYLLTNNEF